jgi:hypothetical protein
MMALEEAAEEQENDGSINREANRQMELAIAQD